MEMNVIINGLWNCFSSVRGANPCWITVVCVWMCVCVCVLLHYFVSTLVSFDLFITSVRYITKAVKH